MGSVPCGTRTRRFAATIAPSPDSMRAYIESALGYLDDRIKSPSDPEFCLEEATRELREALSYLDFFRTANEVLILRATRIEGDIGRKLAVGDLRFLDTADDVPAAPSVVRNAFEAAK